ncbi:hypothetical protein CEY09_26860 [Achromobacter marplatensis]|nr:hypothetical protein CEY09_26860 [Achromobacter marplatensis]
MVCGVPAQAHAGTFDGKQLISTCRDLPRNGCGTARLVAQQCTIDDNVGAKPPGQPEYRGYPDIILPPDHGLAGDDRCRTSGANARYPAIG